MSISPKELAEKRNSLKTNVSIETAIEVLKDAQGISPLERGKIRFNRTPGVGTKGELWFRNSLVWLRTIPLEAGHYFVNFHAESPIYLNAAGPRSFSTDLLGLSYKDKGAKLCAIELKSGADGDNLIYAIAEGTVNLIFSRKNLPQLHSHWKTHTEDQNAWRKGNPFAKIVKDEVVVLGDYAWLESNKALKNSAKQLIRKIKDQFNIEAHVFYFDKGVKPDSKPYRLLNINRFI